MSAIWGFLRGTFLLGTMVAVLLLQACGQGLDANDPTKAAKASTVPFASAGVAQSVFTGELVTLDGSGSSDPNGNTLSYAWTLTTKPAGSAAKLSGASTASPKFTADKAGDYVASLTVSSSGGTSVASTVTVTAAQNHAPTANAGSNRTVITGYTATLDGNSSSDPDGTALTYSWKLSSKPASSSASLSSASTATPSFKPDKAGNYLATLTVSDGLLSDSASVTIKANLNTRPTAVASASPSSAYVATGTQVTLDGSSSADPNGTTVTYSWSLSAPGGSAATLSSTTAAKPKFTADVAGTYTAQLVVSDGVLNSTAATATVNAAAAPVASAGGYQNDSVGTPVTLDGSGSTAPGADTLSYAWTVSAAPLSSAAAPSSTTVSQPSFTPDVDGTYAITLTVTDNTTGLQATDIARVSTVWMINNAAVAPIIHDSSGNNILVNVQSVTTTTLSGVDYYKVIYSGMPDYVHTITAADYSFLTGRPNAATDFRGGTGPSVIAGDVVNWGADINYNSSDVQNGNCYTNQGGLGWWPPGPGCPDNTNTTYTVYIPVTPATATSTCYTQVNSIGLLRNGVPFFNWSDSESYDQNNDGTDDKSWHNVAAYFEQYDVDICLGHAQQQGVYHHHALPVCLTEELNNSGVTDDGSVDSPIYGYAADGYPIYGQYETISGAVVAAQSCWKTRDYSASSSTGCGTAGARTCKLKDNTNPSLGTTTVSGTSVGPNTSGTVTTQSGNTINAISGVFYEDYYFDSACFATGGANLDKHNGHDLGDGRGYHYHLTSTFPYNAGPTYAGKLQSSGLQTCNSSPTPGF